MPSSSQGQKTPSQSRLKQQRRAEREAAERAQALKDRRNARLRAFGTLLAGAAMVAVAALLIFRPGGDSTTASAPDDPFGTNYAGLRARVEQAGLPTMATPEANEHTHQSLAVYVNGKAVPVPDSVGVDPRASGDQMAGLHTHAPGFTIHNEGVAAPTLGQFFAVWGVPFGPTRLGPHRATGNDVVRVWVGEQQVDQFERLPLTDKQRITVSFGPRSAPKPASPPPSVA